MQLRHITAIILIIIGIVLLVFYVVNGRRLFSVPEPKSPLPVLESPSPNVSELPSPKVSP